MHFTKLIYTIARRTRRAPGLLAGAVFILLNANCTTFRGLGEFQPRQDSVDSARSGVNSDSPNIMLNGERRSSGSTEPPSFEWPVYDARMSRGFIYGTKAHWGLDLANRRGTPILASEDGVVIYTGSGFRGYGKLVVVEHGAEWATLYAHLDKITVKEGQRIGKGEILGKMGRTGRSSGVHLHFEVRYRRQPVNPLAYLPDLHSLADSR